MGCEVRERFKMEELCVYLWLIHVDVWQKLTQYCKAIIFQLKNKIKKSLVEATRHHKMDYLEEINKFFERNNLLRLSQEKIENMNRLITSIEL